jgi:hypothetical protein
MTRAGITPGLAGGSAVTLRASGLSGGLPAVRAARSTLARRVGEPGRNHARRRCDRSLLGDRVDVDAVDDGVDTELVDEGLADDVGVVACAEGLRETRRRDAQGQLLAVEGRDLGVLRHERPRDAPHREDASEHVGPRPADGIGVHAAGCTSRRTLAVVVGT